MAEIVTEPRPVTGYSESQLEGMNLKYSRLKPIQPGDVCCNCGLDCDGPGFSSPPTSTASRVRGHPLCARPTCYYAKRAEFAGQRNDCKCGARHNPI